jgi:uncharacterized protein (DUF302 family)
MDFTRILPAFFLVAAASLAPAAALADDWEIKTSPHSVPDTVERLTAAIEGAGAKVAAVIDHAAAAASVDMELAPTTVVIFGNPKLGTPLMQENQKIGIDLPLKILVWQDGGTTRVGYIEPEELAEEYDIDEDHKVIKTMEGALDKLTDAAIAE